MIKFIWELLAMGIYRTRTKTTETSTDPTITPNTTNETIEKNSNGLKLLEDLLGMSYTAEDESKVNLLIFVQLYLEYKDKARLLNQPITLDSFVCFYILKPKTERAKYEREIMKADFPFRDTIIDYWHNIVLPKYSGLGLSRWS